MHPILVTPRLFISVFRRICRIIVGSVVAPIILLAGCGGSSGNSGNESPLLAENEAITVQGRLAGMVDNNLRVFRGVRYAAPLTPEQRFKAPQELPAFEGIYDATKDGPACAQPFGDGITGAEDCLFLNIWAHADSTNRPVMVYMHGGASGGVSGSASRINGAIFAAQTGAIVITANRRLGVIGNLALDELVTENPDNTAGNYEVLDAIQALRWVKQNIAAFNGDPNRVLLAGDSFGGRVICHILAAPTAMGLFQSVAIQSGACGERAVLSHSVVTFTRYAPALYEHKPLLAESGCDTAADVLVCLRERPIEELIGAASRVAETTQENGRDPFGPIIDGVVVQTDPYTALQTNLVGDIPLIVGATRDEVEFLFRRTEVPDDFTYRALLTDIFESPLDSEIYSIYPPTDFETFKEAFLTLMGDVIVNCVAEELARSATGSAPSYLYLVSRGFDSGLDKGRGATHSVDITYFFQSFASREYSPDTQAMAISAAMQNGWSHLAANPGTAPMLGDSLYWPAYEPTDKPHIDFGDPVREANDYRSSRCDALRTLIRM